MRGFALGVATLVNRVTSGTVALSFLSLSRWLSPAGAYYLFAGLAVCAFVFILRRVPETKGRSLEEIEFSMANGFNFPSEHLVVAPDSGAMTVSVAADLELSPGVAGQPAGRGRGEQV